MLNIKIDLVKVSKEDASRQNIKACNFVKCEEMTENDRLASDILAPLSVCELMKQEGNKEQQKNARKIGEMFANCCAPCDGALWFCGDSQEAEALTLADGFRVYAFGMVSRGGCFVLILENSEEKERAYLVRPNW